jgi:hypothetical protein
MPTLPDVGHMHALYFLSICFKYTIKATITFAKYELLFMLLCVLNHFNVWGELFEIPLKEIVICKWNNV